MASPRTIRDANWIKSSFLINASMLDDVAKINRYFTTASLKYTDSSIGGNFCINPPPQFTRHADPKADRIISNNSIYGMGRYYSEAIDDNNQIIHMRFGVPKFNSLTTFFTGFYNADMNLLARTGRSSNTFYTLGKAAGFILSIVAWPLWLINYAGTAIRFLLEKPSSKFYYLKPTMPTYWSAVTTIVNHIAVNKNIVPRLFEGDKENQKLGVGVTKADRALYHKAMPDIFDSDGNVNVYAIATRAQRLSDHYIKMIDDKISESGNMDTVSSIIKSIKSIVVDRPNPSLKEHMDKWLANKQAQPNKVTVPENATDADKKAAEKKSTEMNETVQEFKEGTPTSDDGFWDFIKAELRDGSAFASFRVNYTGSVSESFSNTVGESEIASKFNSAAGQSRSTNFSFANGNVTPIIGDALSAAKNVLSGVLDGFGASGLFALAGSAFVDIPKHWQSSSSSLPKANYTINLVSPYGNAMSRFLNIDIPLAMLLAAALPLSSGKQSYTSPFLLELYDKGKCQTRLGMIDSLSINRGNGNMGFDNNGQNMHIEVNFSVVDMSSIMHMPISEGFSLNPAVALFDEDTVFSDYMAILAGLDLNEQVYPLMKIKRNLTRQMQHWGSFFSKAHLASYVGGTTLGRIVSIPFRQTAR